MRCVLIYNPVSGRNQLRRSEQLQQVMEVLSAHGHEIEAVSTTAPGSAVMQARQAANSGAELIFACGGDGTVNEVVQGLVSETGSPAAALGIIPLGSGNALARHLRISLTPSIAALQQILGTTQIISVGKIIHDDRERYFTIVAGAGPDGLLASKVLGKHKSNLGRLAYYIYAGRLFLTHRFHSFEIEYSKVESNNVEIRKTVGVMAVRIGDLGGLFSKLTSRHNSIDDAHLRLLVLAPPAMISMPLWFVSGWLNLHHLNPFLSFVDVASFTCRDGSGTFPHIQADGEWLGHAPMHVFLVPNALRLCIPAEEVKL